MIYKKNISRKTYRKNPEKNAQEGELDDEKVFELIRGEWVEAKEDEEEDGKDGLHSGKLTLWRCNYCLLKLMGIFQPAMLVYRG